MFNDFKQISLISNGDQKEFERLMEHTSNELLLFAIGFLRNKEVAEELVSDVYVKIWEKRSTLNKIKNLKSYLFICVKNRCLSHLRAQKKSKTVSIDEIQDFHYLPAEGVESELLDRETINHINNAIEKLPPKCKLAFTLAKINGLKHREIAEVMCISEKTVNNHIVSAIKKISENLRMRIKNSESKSPFKRASLF